jgi:hypothetical protein
MALPVTSICHRANSELLGRGFEVAQFRDSGVRKSPVALSGTLSCEPPGEKALLLASGTSARESPFGRQKADHLSEPCRPQVVARRPPETGNAV